MGQEEDFADFSKARALSGLRKWQSSRRNNGTRVLLAIVLMALVVLFLLHLFGKI